MMKEGIKMVSTYHAPTHKNQMQCSPEVLDVIRDYCDECKGDCGDYFCQAMVKKAEALQTEVAEVEEIFLAVGKAA